MSAKYYLPIGAVGYTIKGSMKSSGKVEEASQYRAQKNEEEKIRQWSDIMSIIKFYYIVLFSVLITGCSIFPWQTTKFISYPIETLSEIENFDEIDPNLKIGNVFFYFVSNGIEDTMYATKSPYSLNFVFESFKKENIIINSIQLEFDGKMKSFEEYLFPVNLSIDFPNYINTRLYSGSYKTDYLYELDKVKEIRASINVTIRNDGMSVTKDIKAVAKKKIKRGFLQYRF